MKRDTQHNGSVFMLDVIILKVVILIVSNNPFILSVLMLSVVILDVAMLSDVPP